MVHLNGRDWRVLGGPAFGENWTRLETQLECSGAGAGPSPAAGAEMPAKFGGRSMKKLLVLVIVVLVAAGVFLAATNPTTEDFVAYRAQAVAGKSGEPDTALEKIGRQVLTGAAGADVRSRVQRRNYVFFSLYTYSGVVSGLQEEQYMGIAKRFVRR